MFIVDMWKRGHKWFAVLSAAVMVWWVIWFIHDMCTGRQMNASKYDFFMGLFTFWILRTWIGDSIPPLPVVDSTPAPDMNKAA